MLNDNVISTHIKSFIGGKQAYMKENNCNVYVCDVQKQLSLKNSITGAYKYTKGTIQ